MIMLIIKTRMVQPAMDNNLRYAIMGALYGSGSSLKDLITSSLTDRTNNSKYGDTSLTILASQAHDNLVQDIIRDIVQKEINPKIRWLYHD